MAVVLVLGVATAARAERSEAARMRALLDEAAPAPSAEERATLQRRQQEFADAHHRSTMMVFPVCIGQATDTECAVNLAKLLTGAEVCRACSVGRPITVGAARPDSGEAALWNFAREVRAYLRKTPADADYALFANFVVTPDRGALGCVQFVLCDARGEWVMVDWQNLDPAEHQTGGGSATKSDCDVLIVQRLVRFLATVLADPRSASQGILSGPSVTLNR